MQAPFLPYARCQHVPAVAMIIYGAKACRSFRRISPRGPFVRIGGLPYPKVLVDQAVARGHLRVCRQVSPAKRKAQSDVWARVRRKGQATFHPDGTITRAAPRKNPKKKAARALPKWQQHTVAICKVCKQGYNQFHPCACRKSKGKGGDSDLLAIDWKNARYGNPGRRPTGGVYPVPDGMSPVGFQMSTLPLAPFYVTALDSFMSDWGPVKNMRNVMVFPCRDKAQADIVARNLRDRREMNYVRVARTAPRAQPKTLYTIKMPEQGGRWTDPSRPFRDNPARDICAKHRKSTKYAPCPDCERASVKFKTCPKHKIGYEVGDTCYLCDRRRNPLTSRELDNGFVFGELEQRLGIASQDAPNSWERGVAAGAVSGAAEIVGRFAEDPKYRSMGQSLDRRAREMAWEGRPRTNPKGGAVKMKGHKPGCGCIGCDPSKRAAPFRRGASVRKGGRR